MQTYGRRSKSFCSMNFESSVFLGRNIVLARVKITVTVYIHPISQLILNNWVWPCFCFLSESPTVFRFGVLGFLLSFHFFLHFCCLI